MKKLVVKKVYRGAGKQIGRDVSQAWYANPNNPTAEGINVGDFFRSGSKVRKHCYDKRTVKRLFANEYELIFVVKNENQF